MPLVTSSPPCLDSQRIPTGLSSRLIRYGLFSHSAQSRLIFGISSEHSIHSKPRPPLTLRRDLGALDKTSSKLLVGFRLSCTCRTAIQIQINPRSSWIRSDSRQTTLTLCVPVEEDEGTGPHLINNESTIITRTLQGRKGAPLGRSLVVLAIFVFIFVLGHLQPGTPHIFLVPPPLATQLV